MNRDMRPAALQAVDEMMLRGQSLAQQTAAIGASLAQQQQNSCLLGLGYGPGQSQSYGGMAGLDAVCRQDILSGRYPTSAPRSLSLFEELQRDLDSYLADWDKPRDATP